MKAFFITGNKRSGTSQLVRLLNLHPNIFVSHESDIIWILSNFYNNKPFSPYVWDSPLGMEYTLKTCRHILDKNKTPRENFFAVQLHLMERGSPWLPQMMKKDLIWVGDKKPFQHADPKLIEFILDIFPEAYFIHLVRHPFAVALSADKFKKRHGDIWLDLTLEEKVERWAIHERWVLELKQKAKVLDLKYEDLCVNTVQEMTRIFKFLNLGINNSVLKKASQMTQYTMKNIPKISCSNEAISVMKQYGYKPNGIIMSNLFLGLINCYFRTQKYLQNLVI